MGGENGQNARPMGDSVVNGPAASVSVGIVLSLVCLFGRMDSEELKYWVSFSIIRGIGRAKFSLLLGYFDDLGKAWYAQASDLTAAGLDAKSVQLIIDNRSEISPDAEIKRLEQHEVRALTWNDKDYPSRLREIHDCPPVLYVRGSFLTEDEVPLAVVGTRHASAYGRRVAEEIVGDLVRNGITVVSGLARGIDAVAHDVALKAGGRTIAVCACGLDMVYPSEHVALAHRIIDQGALVSEFALGVRPKGEHFPLRNRIMSGISLGVLVIEAGERSGALITAHQAAEQNRELFAVPGNIFSPTSKGPNHLIQDGAKLVRNCADILEELNLTAVAQQLEFKELVTTTDIESQLLSCLSSEATCIDDICYQSGLPASTVSSLLTILELKGLAKQMGNSSYALI